MALRSRVRLLAPAILAAVGCANAKSGSAIDAGDTPVDDAGNPVDPDAGTCGEFCDLDNDGVPDNSDDCAGTPAGEPVNPAGCGDSQVDPELEPTFPPFGLTWTPTGDLGRAAGLTWTYTGIDHADLFHIYWIVCDDPAMPCGLSLDGPIDTAAEHWTFSAADSSLPAGRLVYTNATNIALADGSSPAVNGRLTLTILDSSNTTFPFAPVATLGVTARAGTHGAEIDDTGYKVLVLAEVQDSSLVWTPYLDYYDAAATPDPGGSVYVSFGGSFYSE